jgi:hypothetical protein
MINWSIDGILHTEEVKEIIYKLVYIDLASYGSKIGLK